MAALPSLLELLNAREVASLVCTQHIVDRTTCAAIGFWLNNRIRSLLPAVEPSRQLQSLQTDTLHIVTVLRLLRQVHAVATCTVILIHVVIVACPTKFTDVFVDVPDTFELHFDGTRHGHDVYLAEHGDYDVLHSGPNGGSSFGDRICSPNAVSYWECVGFEEGCYIGVTEVATHEQIGWHDSGIDAQHVKRTLSLPTPACDHMPAVMYCESGFITTGSFRGPKVQLPANVNFLDADPFTKEDHIGVLVDLLAGFLLFVRNGEPQGMRICIDRSKKYVPVFSTNACYNLQLIRDVWPPWHKIYCFDGSLDNQDTYTYFK